MFSLCANFTDFLSVAVAVNGYYFGVPERSPFLHATCNSTEVGLSACHSEKDQCDPVENAGVICEGLALYHIHRV